MPVASSSSASANSNRQQPSSGPSGSRVQNTREARGNPAGFNASRLPSASGQNPRENTPYRRHVTSDAVAIESTNAPDVLRQVLDEVRKGVEEQRKVKEDIRRVGHVVNKLEENVWQLGDQLKDFMEQSFSIESSPFKVSMSCCRATLITILTLMTRIVS